MLAWLRGLCKKAVVVSGLQPTKERLEEERLEQERNEFLVLQRAREEQERRVENIRREIAVKDEELTVIMKEKRALQQLLMERQMETYNVYSTLTETDTRIGIDYSVFLFSSS